MMWHFYNKYEAQNMAQKSLAKLVNSQLWHCGTFSPYTHYIIYNTLFLYLIF